MRELLRDASSEPGALAAALRAARTAAAAGAGRLQYELLAAELRWLDGEGGGDRADSGASRSAAHAALLRLRLRTLQAEPATPAGIFDLAELRAEAAFLGDLELAAACDRELAVLLPGVAPGEALAEEAAERWATFATEEEDLPLPHKIELLRATGRLSLDLHARTRDRRLGRLGRRMLRAADDRVLALRLEHLLGRRGVVALETGSLVFLVAVLAIVVVDALVALSPGQALALRWIDASLCSFFVAEFLLKQALAPNRLSWFVRNAVTDLLPSIPAVLFLLPGPVLPGGIDDVAVVRLLRLLRIGWAARYVQALRPLLRVFRLLTFLIRGMDGLVDRFSPLLNRNFVFFGGGEPGPRRVADDDLQALAWAALAREQALLRTIPPAARAPLLQARLRVLATDAGRQAATPTGAVRETFGARDIPVEQAVGFLAALQPADLARYLSPSDVRALDRVVRVVSAPVVRWLPFTRRFAVVPLPALPELRVIALGRRVGEWLQGWHGRLLFFGDLHGIVTGPQILDRVASAMVKASQRPAVRLILFGGIAMLLDFVFGSTWVDRFVGLPLLVLGTVCLVFLALGHWLKRIAGEASATFRLTSEAHFVSLLQLVKRRHEPVDLEFLAARVFGAGLPSRRGFELLQQQVRRVRAGGPVATGDAPPHRIAEASRTALLYLHYLDGAPLHASDIKTTEQLLANLSLENIRDAWLGQTKKGRKRLRRLKLDDGTIFAGPYLWFRFITESIAVETAKRITEYNRHCLTLAQQAAAGEARRAELRAWLSKRRDPRRARTVERLPPPGQGAAYATTEFTALEFLGADVERDAHIGALFGEDVLATLRADRRNMIREVFGTRPVQHLPKRERSFNAHRFYVDHLSHGRVLLLPLLATWRVLRWVGWVLRRISVIVREILVPHRATQQRQSAEAPFRVALRKIHRMKAPGLLEAIHTRLQFDPEYCGAPAGWSTGTGFAPVPPFERDLDFLHLSERARVEMRGVAARSRQRVEELHAALAWLPDLCFTADPEQRADGELAVTIAWINDRQAVRTLLLAERWRTEVLPDLAVGTVHGTFLGDFGRALAGLVRAHPVDRWLQAHGPASRCQRKNLRRAFGSDHRSVRTVLGAWLELGKAEAPAEAGLERLRAAFRDGEAARRELGVLRAVQSLSVLDVRTYRALVFRIGAYADDGEDPAVAEALP